MSDRWGWLETLIREIKTRSFFGEWADAAEVDAALASWPEPAPVEVHELFRELRIQRMLVDGEGAAQFAFMRTIEPSPFDDREEWLCFAFDRGFDLFFLREELRRGGVGIHVFRSRHGSSPKDAGCDLPNYMRRVLEDDRRRGPRKWARLLAGARPFTAREREILDATNAIEAEVLSIEDGFAKVRVKNPGPGMARQIGFEVKTRRLHGKVYVPVTDLRPGQERLVTVGVYRDVLSTAEARAEIALSRVTEFNPELRQSYWELRK